MSSPSKSSLPFFPVPPQDYDQRYFSELIRAFSVYVAQQNNPGEGRNTTLVLTNLPTSASGLEVGSVYNDSGTLKVVT
jgi:hypothetical protein